MSLLSFLLMCGIAAGLTFALAVLVSLFTLPRPRGFGFEVRRDE